MTKQKSPKKFKGQYAMLYDSPVGLKPNVETGDPYAGHKNRINQTKYEHYQNHISSENGERQVDLVFNALRTHPDSTDREIQAVISRLGRSIEISAIPARRADIPKFYSDYEVITTCRKICSITGTKKQAWRLVKK